MIDKEKFLAWVADQPCRWETTDQWVEFAAHVVQASGICSKCGLSLNTVATELAQVKRPLMVYDNVFFKAALRERLMSAAKSCLTVNARARTETATQDYESYRAQREM